MENEKRYGIRRITTKEELFKLLGNDETAANLYVLDFSPHHFFNRTPPADMPDLHNTKFGIIRDDDEYAEKPSRQMLIAIGLSIAGVLAIIENACPDMMIVERYEE